MQPLDLLKTAELLATAHKGKPSQANLRRAASTAYYAMFHCLAKACADLLIGGAGANKGQMAWRQAYRALEHTIARNACMNGKVISRFPKGIEDFANAFTTMQEKRHKADYDPYVTITKSEVTQDIAIVRQAIADFASQSAKDRRAFCVWVLFKNRP